MTVVSFRTKRTISDLILNIDSGSVVDFFKEVNPVSRKSIVVSLADEVAKSFNIEVDIESTVNSGRRPKRFEIAFLYGENLIVAGVAGSGDLIDAISRIAKGIDVVRSEADRLESKVMVIGYVFEFDSSDHLTPRQEEYYAKKCVFHGSVDELKSLIQV